MDFVPVHAELKLIGTDRVTVLPETETLEIAILMLHCLLLWKAPAVPRTADGCHPPLSLDRAKVLLGRK